MKLSGVVLTCVTCVIPVHTGEEEVDCFQEIQALDFLASSEYQFSVGARQAKLRNDEAGGAWCPSSLIHQLSDVQEYIEILLDQEYTITSIITQGRFADGLGLEFAEHVIIKYWRTGLEDYREFVNRAGEHILQANTDTNTQVQIKLDVPFVASRVRIIPFSFHSRTVCLRVGVTGCAPPGESADMVTGGRRRKFTLVQGEVEEMATSYLAVAIGVLITLISFLISVIFFILYKHHRAEHGSPGELVEQLDHSEGAEDKDRRGIQPNCKPPAAACTPEVGVDGAEEETDRVPHIYANRLYVQRMQRPAQNYIEPV